MFLGAPARNIQDIRRLRSTNFDFAEIALANAMARRMWWESGIVNGAMGRFFLTAHGPLEDNPWDLNYLWNHYWNSLTATVDMLYRMSMNQLNIHLLVDRRIVSNTVFSEKMRFLNELIRYSYKNGISISLENVSETVEDLEKVLLEVPDINFTLDVGHANLRTEANKSFSIIDQLGRHIRHIHFHDNEGGEQHKDDAHLAIGEGNIDFLKIVKLLKTIVYTGTITLEVPPEQQSRSRELIQSMITCP